MKKIIIALLAVTFVACNKTSKENTNKTDSTAVATDTSANNITEPKNTGVLKNGDATADNPAFTNSGGEIATWDNIVRAETSKYMVAEQIENGTNHFRHERNGIDLKNQTVIRSNFDLIYSYAVYDISGGIKITVPPYDFYQIVQVLDENSVTIGVCYPGQTLQLKPTDATYGSHVYLFMRTQPPSLDEAGMEKMRQRQNSVIVEAGSAKPYVPEVKYDVASFNKLRSQIIKDAVTRAVIEKGFVDNIKDISKPQYQYINLAGWAGLPAKHAYYFVVLPGDEAAKNGAPSSVTFKQPDLQYDKAGYWSLTIYNEEGWVKTDPFHLNSHEVKKNADGTITLNFNNPGAINNIQVPKNWNGLFRCYLPVNVKSMIAYKEDFTKNHKVLALKK